jgi:hypothetical protein
MEAVPWDVREVASVERRLELVDVNTKPSFFAFGSPTGFAHKAGVFFFP